ncbi:MAG TPA: glycosyltransferase [Bacteroidia bacterium]|nr:glycosyltransferase [Bacteroidia bacterium]
MTNDQFSKKNIIIGPAYPYRGGIANFNDALCKAFNDEGIESSIISFTLQYPGFLFPGKTQYENNGYKPPYKIETLINSINPITWFRAAKKIKKEKPDYIIIRYWLPFMAPCLGTIARLVKKNSSIKVIAITDNIIPHEKRPGDKSLTNYFVKSCDAFIAMSGSVMNDLKTFTGKKTIFTPHPIYNIFGEKISKHDAIEKLGLDENDRHILFFGFIRKYKGLDLLLEAMSDEKVKSLDVKLIVAGEFYDDPQYYLDLINKYRIENNVILKTEYVPKEAVKYFFCAADMIVQPYRDATQSGVTQIAYHFERPMLVTDVGGLSEIIPDNVVGYVTKVNPGEIANAIADFYSNNREGEFSKNTALEKNRFSWDKIVHVAQELAGDKRAEV